MQKIKTIIKIWMMFTRDQRHMATFPSWIPCFFSKNLWILLMREFSSKFSSKYFYGGFLKVLFRLILAMKFLARILTLCLVTILLSLKRSFFFSYLIWFWRTDFWDSILSLLLCKVPVKSLCDSDRKLRGLTVRSS